MHSESFINLYMLYLDMNLKYVLGLIILNGHGTTMVASSASDIQAGHTISAAKAKIQLEQSRLDIGKTEILDHTENGGVVQMRTRSTIKSKMMCMGGFIFGSLILSGIAIVILWKMGLLFQTHDSSNTQTQVSYTGAYYAAPMDTPTGLYGVYQGIILPDNAVLASSNADSSGSGTVTDREFMALSAGSGSASSFLSSLFNIYNTAQGIAYCQKDNPDICMTSDPKTACYITDPTAATTCNDMELNPLSTALYSVTYDANKALLKNFICTGMTMMGMITALTCTPYTEVLNTIILGAKGGKDYTQADSTTTATLGTDTLTYFEGLGWLCAEACSHIKGLLMIMSIDFTQGSSSGSSSANSVVSRDFTAIDPATNLQATLSCQQMTDGQPATTPAPNQCNVPSSGSGALNMMTMFQQYNWAMAYAAYTCVQASEFVAISMTMPPMSNMPTMPSMPPMPPMPSDMPTMPPFPSNMPMPTMPENMPMPPMPPSP